MCSDSEGSSQGGDSGCAKQEHIVVTNRAFHHDCYEDMYVDQYIISFEGERITLPEATAPVCMEAVFPRFTALPRPLDQPRPDGVKAEDLDVGPTRCGLQAKSNLRLVFVQPTKQE